MERIAFIGKKRSFTTNHFFMKKYVLLLAVAVCLIALAAFTTSTTSPKVVAYEYSHVTTIESVVAGGLGRSRMLINEKGGTKDEIDMKNFFSLAGINFQNINTNEQLILEKISQMNANGWELHQVTPGVVSPNGNGGTGLFITRYLFRKAK
jgi:hypothetical protein